MSTLEQYTEALHRFCDQLSEVVANQADGGDTDQVAILLDYIRQTIANLLLCELECERVLHRG